MRISRLVVFLVLATLVSGGQALGDSGGNKATAPTSVAYELKSAYRSFAGHRDREPMEMVDIRLRTFCLGTSSDATIAEQRRFMGAAGYDQAFIDRFDEAARWVDRLRGDAPHAFELAMAARKRDSGPVYELYAYNLRGLAIQMHYRPAEYDWVDELFASDDPEEHKSACDRLVYLAGGGEVQAAFELGRRYKDGDLLPKDYARAYYWYVRAMQLQVQKNEADRAKAKAILSTLLAQVSQPSREDSEKQVRELMEPLASKVALNYSDGFWEIFRRISPEDLRKASAWLDAQWDPLCLKTQ